VLALWVAALIVAGPVGNFPIDDDFSTAEPVKTLVIDHGRFVTAWFSAMTLVTQVVWASPFVAVAGFSFNVLRMSTIILTAIGLVGLWRLALQCGLPRATAVFVTAAVALNPVVFLLTNSFMTDVPFAA